MDEDKCMCTPLNLNAIHNVIMGSQETLDQWQGPGHLCQNVPCHSLAEDGTSFGL